MKPILLILVLASLCGCVPKQVITYKQGDHIGYAVISGSLRRPDQFQRIIRETAGDDTNTLVITGVYQIR